MNIVFLCREYDRSGGYGGIGTYVEHISKALSKKGHNIFIISSLPRENESVNKKDNIEIFYPKQKRLKLIEKILCFLKLGNIYLRIMCSYTNYKTVKYISSKHKIDIINSPEWFNEGLFCCLLLNIPVVVRIHGPVSVLKKFSSFSLLKYLEEFLEKITVSLSQAVIFPTEKMHSYLKNTFKFKRYSIIPICMSKTDVYMAEKSSKKQVVCIGRIEKIKNQEVIIKSIPYVVKEEKNVIFVFVGRNVGDYYIMLSNLIKELNISQFVKFTGEIEWEALNKIKKESNIIVKPSLDGGLDMSLIEALESGLPLVCSDISPFNEVIKDNYSGFLVNPNSEKEWAEKILIILKDKNIADKISSNAFKEFKEKYCCDVVAEKELELYRDVVLNYDKKHRL